MYSQALLEHINRKFCAPVKDVQLAEVLRQNEGMAGRVDHRRPGTPQRDHDVCS